MKIGRLEVKLAEKPKQDKPSYGEFGATGTTIFGGNIAEEEYNRDLQGSNGRTVYERMRRSDGQVKAALLACKLPLRSVVWNVDPASEDKADIAIAETVEANLLHQMSITWDSVLAHVLLMLDFGFSPLEKVWEVRDGKIALRKLAPRLPKTLHQWKLDEEGGLAGIQQFVFKGGKYQFIDIPAEKLVVFTNEKEGSNFEGVSIIRNAYKHWFYKDNLYRIDAMAAERHALGIPVFTYPAGATEADKRKLDEMGARLYAQEQAFVRLAHEYELDIKGLSGTIKDILPSIQEHNRQIAVSILADFLALAGSERGSYALSKDQSNFFLMSLQSIATNICDTFNAYCIPQMVDYNFRTDSYPTLRCGNLFTRDMVNYANAVSQLVREGALTPDLETENTLRDLLKLPERQEPEAQQAEKRRYWQGIEFARELTPAEQSVNFGEIDNALDGSEEKIVSAAKEVQRKQIDKLVDVTVKIIEKRQVDRLEDIDVPFRREMASAISDVLMELYKYGRQQVKQEIGRQKNGSLAEPYGPEPLGPNEIALIKSYLLTRARADVNLLATRLRSAVTFEALNQIRQGVIDRAALDASLNSLSDAELKKAAGYAVSEAFNFGRSSQAEKMKDEIARAQYSALMDGGTCAECEKMDGQEWDFNDDRTLKYARGNPECLGKTRCRCVLVYIAAEERRNPR